MSEIIAITDSVVPPLGVRIPDPAILVGVFGKLSILTFGCHLSEPSCWLGEDDEPRQVGGDDYAA